MKNKCMTYLLCLMALLPATNGQVATKTGTISGGTVQLVMFDHHITAPDTTCSSLLSFTAGDLGTSPVCSLSWRELIIQLGDSMNPGNPTITLISGGFTDGLTGGLTFTRISETKFIFSTGAAGSHYQDYVNKWTVLPVNTNGGCCCFTYAWTYASGTGGPSLPASGTTLVFDFNYWEATIGQGYSITVNMTDDNNAQFYYASTGGVFTVLDSCISSCDTVTWTMTNDPGSVSPTCTSGQGGDTVSCTKGAGGGPYQILATYNPTSLGDHAGGLTLLEAGFDAPTGFSLPATCGSTLSFPSVAVNTDALAIQSSGSQFAFEAAITNRGLTVTTDYTITWRATNSGGIGYCGTTTDSPTCTIPADGTLAAGTAYAYTVALKLTCKSSIVWQDATFRTFTYTAIFTTTSTVGSVQTLTFTEPMSQHIALSDPGSDSCGNILVSAGVADVGTGAKCTMPTSFTLQIEYGNGYTIGGNLVLKTGVMDKWITHTFAKPLLPTVTYTAPMEDTTINQDSGNIVMTFSITTVGSPTWLFTWECTAGPECPTTALASQTANPLDLATSNLKKGGSYTFKGTVRQSGVINYLMTESITFLFLIRMKTDTQIGNTIVLQSAGHLFNLTCTDCTVIFDVTDQGLLGTGSTCTHVVNSDTITIVLGNDTSLRSTTPLTLTKNQYFEDYSITIFHSGSFSSGVTTMKGSLWYIPLAEAVTVLGGGGASTDCADYFDVTVGITDSTCVLESGGTEIVVRFASADAGVAAVQNTYVISHSKFSKNIYGKHTNQMPDVVPTMTNTSTPADGATDTQDVGTVVMTFAITAASTKAAPG